MRKFILPIAAFAVVGLSGCIITDTDGDWDEKSSVAERTRLAIEACGEGNVAEVDSRGFECKGNDADE